MPASKLYWTVRGRAVDTSTLSDAVEVGRYLLLTHAPEGSDDLDGTLNHLNHQYLGR